MNTPESTWSSPVPLQLGQSALVSSAQRRSSAAQHTGQPTPIWHTNWHIFPAGVALRGDCLPVRVQFGGPCGSRTHHLRIKSPLSSSLPGVPSRQLRSESPFAEMYSVSLLSTKRHRVVSAVMSAVVFLRTSSPEVGAPRSIQARWRPPEAGYPLLQHWLQHVLQQLRSGRDPFIRADSAFARSPDHPSASLGSTRGSPSCARRAPHRQGSEPGLL